MPRGVIKNPFRYGGLALDDHFANRTSEIRDLKADAINGQDVVVFAPRRWGKSSLIWAVMRELVKEKVLVANVNLMKTPTKEKLAAALAKSIHENIASPLERASKKAMSPFQGLRVQPTITVSPEDGSFGFSFDVGRQRGEIDATLEQLLELPGKYAVDRKRDVVLIIDEFQEIVEIDPKMPMLLRSVFEEQPEVGRVYLGSKRHMMEKIFNDENEPFWKAAKKMPLDVIPPAEFEGFIRDRFASTGKSVDDAVLKDLLDLTGGHPHATQELCYALWEKTPASGAADDEVLIAAKEAVISSEYAHFSLIWDSAAPMQRLLLQALAQEPGRPMSADYRARYGLPPTSTIQKAIQALSEREILAKREDGSIWISVPYLAAWIRENMLEQSTPSDD